MSLSLSNQFKINMWYSNMASIINYWYNNDISLHFGPKWKHFIRDQSSLWTASFGTSGWFLLKLSTVRCVCLMTVYIHKIRVQFFSGGAYKLNATWIFALLYFTVVLEWHAYNNHNWEWCSGVRILLATVYFCSVSLLFDPFSVCSWRRFLEPSFHWLSIQ